MDDCVRKAFSREETPPLATSMSDFHSLVCARADGNAGVSRRGFVRGAVGSGFAAAVLPTLAQTAIKTDSAGLVVGEVNISVGDFKMPAYRAAPSGKVGAPVVLVISEVFGVHEYIADVARRFAKAGYFAVAPELFARQGDPQSYGEVAKLLVEVVEKVPDDQVMRDLDSCAAWARGQGADASRLAVTGFCWGGRITWLYAAHNPGMKVGVAWYGRLEGQTSPLRPRHPVDVGAQMHAPVLGLYGEKDTGIPLESVQRQRAALAAGSAAAKRSEFVIYPDAPHAFHADYRPTFRKEPAEDGWRRCLAWFQAHGVA